jgi:hypothetical protein
VGEGTLVATYDGQESAAFPVREVDAAPGLFTRNQSGVGPAVAYAALPNGELRANAITDPVRPGQTLLLSMTGLGPLGGPSPEVVVGGLRAAVLSRSRQDCCPGIDQVAVTVPQGVVGCYVPVAVRVGEAVGNFATITVDPSGSACSDPLGPGSEDLEALRSAGSLPYLLVDLTRLAVGDQYADSGDALALRTEHDRLVVAPGGRSIPVGTCVAQWSPGGGTADIRVAEGLDAGALGVTVGAETRAMLPRFGSPGLYSGSFNRFLEPGPVSVDNGPGGAVVGAFRASATMPDPVRLLNAEALREIDRSADLVVRWSLGVPDRDAVVVYGVASTDGGGSAGFYCLADPAPGMFAVPAMVLSTLPRSADGVLGVGATLRRAARFQATGIRFGAIAASNLLALPAAYR